MIRDFLPTFSRHRSVALVLMLLAAIACALVGPQASEAANVRLTTEELARGAQRVVVADVKSVAYRRDPSWGIATDVELLLVRALKGTAPSSILLSIPGGSIDGEVVHVTETPSFAVGERVVIFLGRDGGVVGGIQGRLGVLGERVIETGETLHRLEGRVRMGETSASVRRAFPEMFGLAGSSALEPDEPATTPSIRPATLPEIAGLSPASSPAGTGDTITITGSGFGSRSASSAVEFFYRDGRPPIVASGVIEIPVWTDTHIEVVVPAKAHDGYAGASASSGPVNVVTSSGRSNSRDLAVPYSVGGPSWPDFEVSFGVLPNTPDTTQELAMVIAAAEEWSRPSRLALQFGGQIATASFPNNANEVSWQNIGEGPLARAWYRYDASGEIVEADIQFNSDLSWIQSAADPRWGDGQTEDSYDVQTVALHEFGHWLVLRDLYGTADSAKAMYGRVSDNQQRRSLSMGDEAGIVRLYGAADRIAPLTSVLDAPVGWVRDPVSLHLSASDAHSTVAATYYRIGDGPVLEYAGSIDIGSEGATRVRYWSTDAAGNVEPEREVWVRIDQTPPASSLHAGRPFFGTASLKIEAEDPLSGVSATYHRIDGGPVRDSHTVDLPSPGTYRVEYWSTDVVGNIEVTRSTTVSVEPVPAIELERIAGADRYLTALEISRRTFDAADTAVLATGRDFPDALAASGLAGTYAAPLLLANGVVTDELVAELERLGTTTVLVVGGVHAVPAEAEQQLVSLGYTVDRIAGSTRYETAALVAARIADEAGGGFVPRAFLVRGDTFADALAVAPHAYAQRAPVLLTQPTALPSASTAAISECGVTGLTVVGGIDAVSAQVQGQLENRGVACDRVAGADRYDTSARLVAWSISQGSCSPTRIGLAVGTSFPDALGGGAALGIGGDALLLTHGDALPECVGAALLERTHDIDSVLLLGGTSAIGNEVEAAVRSLWNLP